MNKRKAEEIRRAYTAKRGEIIARLNAFKRVRNQDIWEIFAELCFCICTPQTRARAADRAITHLKETGLLRNGGEEEISRALREAGVRFHRTKAHNIILAREKIGEIRKIILNNPLNAYEARELLVSSIRGLGMKEASHFLRNIGYSKLAIIDRHILRNLLELGAIREIPRSISKKRYLELESIFMKTAHKLGIPSDSLDLVMWSLKTGEVFK
ncbi:MAG: N-glycosylase/DNA lyase [Aigarchaeota archaeon]|nr:N-glycosylase/DNA lyase [Candidatus Pelearchaeum maunauluense]